MSHKQFIGNTYDYAVRESAGSHELLKVYRLVRGYGRPFEITHHEAKISSGATSTRSVVRHYSDNVLR